jgi:penicillin-binding protein 1A
VGKAPALGKAPERRWGRLLARTIIAVVWGGLGLAVVALWLLYDLPRPRDAIVARRPTLTLEDRGGRVIARYGDIVGATVHIAALPAYLPAAVVAVEDRRFFSHGALDLWGMARAFFIDLTAGRVVQGGSTLTQQVAKTLFLSNQRTFRRKIQEILLAFWLYDHFSRDQILEIWLNRVYLGAGTFGVDAAARVYFGVPAQKLTLWQAAMIAGIPRAPARFNPRADAKAAIARTRQVLAAMVANGAITPAAAEAAIAAIALPPNPGGGWFADWAAEQAEPALPPGEDATLRTTLDQPLQNLAQARLKALLDGPGAAAAVGEGAVVALDAASGAIRVMVGGRAESGGGFNRAVAARRQPGSAFKPLVWLAALAHGETPESLVEDAPIRVGTWAPHDVERRYLGSITLTTALAQSSNTAAVRLLLRSGGPRAVIAWARKLGLTDPLPQDATLALGSASVGLLELTASYAPFFNGGFVVRPRFLERAPPERNPVMTPEEAEMMRVMLGAVVSSGTGRAAAIAGEAIAGKTGTSQAYRDAWFIGAVRGLVIGVWLGNDDGTPMKAVTGGSLPARLFHDLAEAVVHG